MCSCVRPEGGGSQGSRDGLATRVAQPRRGNTSVGDLLLSESTPRCTGWLDTIQEFLESRNVRLKRMYARSKEFNFPVASSFVNKISYT